MKSAEIREAFLAYFEEQGHTRVASSSLVPADDPTLLFTNAGMNQFKDTFLGRDPRAYNRATSSQRCVRAGGKHNDLENVGYTARHHTFFEMLGNFSFGDYFKREAIQYCWEFLTVTLGLPAEKLWITVHVSDDEAADIWINEVGVSPDRLSRLDEDNFWQMGDTGPCGPSSEVFYDHGAEVPGGPPGSEDDDLDRYIEIWNLVFMQYNRDSQGNMEPLPAPSVDTGMGLERVAAVMQGVHTNYEIDLFQNLLKAAAEVLSLDSLEHNSMNVIVDHIRSCAFLVLDGVLPGNEGRGYVLRRIVRRAIRHGNKLGARQPFFHKLVGPLAREMGAAYPDLLKEQARIEKALLAEEEQFAKTLDNGMGMLEEALTDLPGSEIPGAVVFKLYDTYGFPVDLTNDIARERGLSLDMPGYDAAMAEQRRRSQESGSFSIDYNDALELEGSTEFTGYDALAGAGTVTALLSDGEIVESIRAGDNAVVVLDRTPFYAESGGQVGDSGYLTAADINFEVATTRKGGNQHLHHGVLQQGSISVGDTLTTEVSAEVREATALNHSATHLLHAALRQVLGDHVAQKGSLVDAQRLRFDFSHGEAVSAEQIKQIEAIVNTQVRTNTAVETQVTDMDSAVAAGAMALFGEKYGDEVRVLSMGDGFSVELCGGTHVTRTGDIGLLRITSESGISAGVRRIEAVTGASALAAMDEAEARLAAICDVVKGNSSNVTDKVAALRTENRELEKQLAQLKQKLASSAGGDLAGDAVEVGGFKVLAANVAGADAKSLRDTMDQLKNKLGSAVILLAAVEDDKIALSAGVTKDLTDQVKAGDLMREFAGRLGGKGGGRPDMAQGGGSDVAGLDAALAAVPEWVQSQL
ncbi:alanine--tRNA ligase [Halieaceae bacterium IMCC14734]|uniref:Alanine--tRNA ligase n=1 Tax=Candidatus Litorirhabdus singularis TaxID=2518993 RepID=A0ABT3TGF2_9GAMM|nr:alanine--tRNA ligase [Candidatus Litorirhabdus singularis]MCX2980900.1 alanine--tRNA ligase [Candidatus Litorirhabdus singularis]